jgi:hypothetical protein
VQKSKMKLMGITSIGYIAIRRASKKRNEGKI